MNLRIEQSGKVILQEIFQKQIDIPLDSFIKEKEYINFIYKKNKTTIFLELQLKKENINIDAILDPTIQLLKVIPKENLPIIEIYILLLFKTSKKETSIYKKLSKKIPKEYTNNLKLNIQDINQLKIISPNIETIIKEIVSK